MKSRTIYLFIHGLFNHTVRLKNGPERMLKKAVVAYLRWYRINMDSMRETTENLTKYSRFMDWDIKPGPADYETEVLPTWPRSLIVISQE
jgi:hypothetical protein